jgi:hypothetical protein
MKPSPSPFDEPEIVRAGSPVEIAELAALPGDDSATSTNSASPPAHKAAYPKDSVLENFMAFAREYSESEDAMLIGAMLPIVSRLLARRVFIRFAGRKYANLYSLLVTKPGLRKSTNIRLVEKLGRALLPSHAFIGGATSEQALFKQYQADPDRLLIEEEGNTVLSNWASDAAGKIVAKRFLKLYDCASWQQDYIRQKEEDGDEMQRIEETSTSLLIGTTFNNCRFHGLETRDGMRRRVCYYVSEDFARTIYWPPDLDGETFARVADAFRPLLELDGEMSLTGDAQSLWNDLQDRNREEIRGIKEINNAAEAYGSALAEEQSRTLKIAMIFEACRWAANRARKSSEIQRDTLQLAAEHGRYCLSAGRSLDAIGRRGEIRDEADAILAKIRTDFTAFVKDGRIELTRTQLTSRFAPNPGRNGAMTPGRLYSEIIPDLITRQFAREIPKAGKLHVYQFMAGD